MRKIIFENDKYYHIYNRGVDKRDIFVDNYDFIRAIKSLSIFNSDLKHEERIYLINKHREANKELSSEASELSSLLVGSTKLVNIVCYSLNKNHYHLIIKQVVDSGVKIFMHKFGTGYTNYFNKKYKRSGSLFQGPYKAKHIKTKEYLIWLSAYVNGNPEIHKTANTKKYIWSSYQDYLHIRKGMLCDKKIILNEFNNNVQDYEGFSSGVIKSCRDKKEFMKELEK